ncbi:hypothetical protein BCF50_0273 [Chryseobacterium daecheongense]|uniref:Uncharacterized protein n=1 Tax=Chryseobacterium daecheongense TaxID=192389 RepID=A0A3N0W8U8_9FLAO|nr:hypothetical protein EGI05_06445 [Chryseobacterium daecheongense]TDX94505.1 hypothetical protein BCF50_0273 [Chryseobacterium daecheongense]
MGTHFHFMAINILKNYESKKVFQPLLKFLKILQLNYFYVKISLLKTLIEFIYMIHGNISKKTH